MSGTGRISDEIAGPEDDSTIDHRALQHQALLGPVMAMAGKARPRRHPDQRGYCLLPPADKQLFR
jgi:hypothetical protein